MHIFPSFAPGGAELRVAKIINGTDFRNTILALTGDYSAAPHIRPGNTVDYLEPPPGRGGLLFFRRLGKLIRETRPDVVLTYNWGTIDAVAAAVLRRLCPVVHNECGLGADEAAHLKARRVLARRVLLNHVFATVVTSRAMQSICLEKYRLQASQVRFVRTGVDAEHFHPGISRTWRSELAIDDSEFVIGFAGALRPEKDVGLLIRAFASARIPRSRLLIIGDGPCRGALENLARELTIGESVIFAGYQTDVAARLPALDLFCLSSATEQTSNALLEAMACGLPAVATDVGDSRELLGMSAASAVIPPGDVDAYASALRALAAAPELRARWGAENCDRCRNAYSLDRMIREYEALYYAAARSWGTYNE
jgi:L-malate glycosyltransferase